MKIIPFEEKYRQDFIRLNREWISRMFTLEPQDEKEFENIDGYLKKGGQIFLAVDDNHAVIATCMIAPRDDGDWEIMKFGARGMYTGTGAGSACFQACLDYAREKKVSRIIIVTARKCTHAIHIYEKFGFREMPVDRKKFPFERADIAFEKDLN